MTDDFSFATLVELTNTCRTIKLNADALLAIPKFDANDDVRNAYKAKLLVALEEMKGLLK